MNTNVVFSLDLLLAITNSKDPELVNLTESERLQAMADYQKFLELAKVVKHPIVPTKRIDAVWHLHMLHPVAYNADCMNYFGYILDHRPSDGTEVNKAMLEQELKKLCVLWKMAFGEPYTPPVASCGSGGDCSACRSSTGGDCHT